MELGKVNGNLMQIGREPLWSQVKRYIVSRRGENIKPWWKTVIVKKQNEDKYVDDVTEDDVDNIEIQEDTEILKDWKTDVLAHKVKGLQPLEEQFFWGKLCVQYEMSAVN